MYTLKGIFPEPKKEQKKNFIRENMKQLKFIQGKSPKEPKYTMKAVHPPRLTNPIATGTSLGQVKSSPSTKSGKISFNVGKASSANNRKKVPNDLRIMKGDMAEFLKRKALRQKDKPEDLEEDEVRSEDSSGRVRDIGCQTIESNLSQKFNESAKLTVLYPKQPEEEKLRASGDGAGSARREEGERTHSRLNAILERKERDPYLPSGYQKGVVPAYLRRGRAGGEGSDDCPAGHVALPDHERKDTLRMLRNSFAELVNELNKLPVKTDTLKMRSRKMELERQLAKLEDGIKVFSRPKVYVKVTE